MSKYKDNIYGLGDFLTAINYSKENLLRNDPEIAVKEYEPYIINMCLSNFVDTVMYVNEINQKDNISKTLQFDYLLNIIRKRKRYSPWFKKKKVDNLELIKEYFSYSDEKALSVIDLISDKDIKYIKEYLDKGGKK